MPRSYWLPYIALVGCLIWLLTFTDLSQRLIEPQGYGQQTSATERKERGTPIGAAIKNPSGRYSAQPCKDPAKGDNHDLCQQWRMAEATEALLAVTRSQYHATVIEILLIILALGVAGYAAVKAKDAAEQARRGADIADKSLASSQRPWVSVEPKLASSFVFKDGDGRISVGFMLKNHGPSPAINVEIVCEIVPYIQTGWDALHELSAKAKSRKIYRMVGHKIFPGEEFPYSVSIPLSRKRIEGDARAQFPDNEIYSEMVKSVTPVIFGYVVYNSTFNDENHVSEFMGFLSKQRPGSPNARIGISTADGEIPIDALRLDRGFGGAGRAS